MTDVKVQSRERVFVFALPWGKVWTQADSHGVQVAVSRDTARTICDALALELDRKRPATPKRNGNDETRGETDE